MSLLPKPQAYLENIATYVPGKSGRKGQSGVIKLSSNENPNGASPSALEAYRAAESGMHRYPEDGARSLREAIGALHGFSPDRIICGAGSDDVIRMLCMAYGGAGREVLYSQYGFAMYPIYAQQSGAATITAAETHLCANVDALLAAVTQRTSLVFIANPNNPTGSYLSKDEIYRLRRELRDDIVLVLDGAYAEYMIAEDYTDGRELCDDTNTVIMRTFSKAYGLGGLRIGWGYGRREIIDTLYKVRSPFNLTQASIDAAIAALSDQDYIARHVAENNAQRERLEHELSALGFTMHPCFANFVLLQHKDAAAIAAYLSERNIIVREIANYGLPDFLRITVGTPAQNDALLEALKGFNQ